jgi:hypothetical protein
MKPHCSAMPWVPGIADFTAIPNMGVVLLSCITPNETIKAKATGYCFLEPRNSRSRGSFAVRSD